MGSPENILRCFFYNCSRYRNLRGETIPFKGKSLKDSIIVDAVNGTGLQLYSSVHTRKTPQICFYGLIRGKLFKIPHYCRIYGAIQDLCASEMSEKWLDATVLFVWRSPAVKCGDCLTLVLETALICQMDRATVTAHPFRICLIAGHLRTHAGQTCRLCCLSTRCSSHCLLGF